MPRRVACSSSRVFGNTFVLIATSVVSLIIYSVLDHYLPLYRDRKVFAFLVGFGVVLFMLAWSFVQAMVTDPGEVPPFWVGSM